MDSSRHLILRITYIIITISISIILDSGVAVGKNRENNGAERIPLVTSNKDELRNDKNDFNLALYEVCVVFVFYL